MFPLAGQSGVAMNAERKKIVSWWNFNMHKFLLPPAYHHNHEWEDISVGVVGCSLCGIIHKCGVKNIAPCQLEIQDDSSVVCVLTGLVSKQSSFYDSCISTSDYRVQSISTSYDQPKTDTVSKSKSDQMEAVRAVAEKVIRDLLYSENSKEAKSREIARMSKKVKSSFMSSCTSCESQSRLCVISALEKSIETFNNFDRKLDSCTVPEFDYWEDLVTHVCFTLTTLKLPKQFYISSRNENFRNLVLAFIFMCKSGLTVNSVLFVPYVELFSQILPLEVFIWGCFCLQPKALTEGENVIKQAVNNMTLEEIQKFDRNRPRSCVNRSQRLNPDMVFEIK